MLATIQAFAQSGMVKDLTRKDQAQIIREADSVITLKMREYGVLGASIVLVDAHNLQYWQRGLATLILQRQKR